MKQNRIKQPNNEKVPFGINMYFVYDCLYSANQLPGTKP